MKRALESILESVSHGIPSSAQSAEARPDWVSCPILQIQDLDGADAPPMETLRTWWVNPRTDRERYALRSGDVVVSARGPVHKVALVGPATVGTLYSGNLIRVRAKPDIIRPDLLALFLASDTVGRKLRGEMRGDFIAYLATGPIERLVISVPPLEEQDRLVSMLRQARRLRDLSEASATAASRLAEAVLLDSLTDPTSKG